MVNPQLPLDELEIVALDLETTGLSPLSDRIVELGAVRFRGDGTELGRFEQLVDPECEIPFGASRIHGITQAMIAGQPTIAEALPSFLEFLGGNEALLVVHYADFDMGFLVIEHLRRGWPIPQHTVVDSLEFARRRVPRAPNHKLATLGWLLGVADHEDHRALADSLLLKDVFLSLVGRQPAITDVASLFRHAGPRPFSKSNVRTATLPHTFAGLAEAVAEGRAVRVCYHGGTKGSTPRTVTPRHILWWRDGYYLVAFCHVDRQEKSFRLDRISSIEPT